jgi:hypothetical protein
LDTSNYAELVPKLRVDQWLRDRVTRAAQSGRVVIIPDRYLRIEKWYGTGWTELDPLTGAGGYLIVGVMTYMNTGEAGNTSIELGPEHVSVGGHAAQPMNMVESLEKFPEFADYTKNKVGTGSSGWGYFTVPFIMGGVTTGMSGAGFAIGGESVFVGVNPYIAIGIGIIVLGIIIYSIWQENKPIAEYDTSNPTVYRYPDERRDLPDGKYMIIKRYYRQNGDVSVIIIIYDTNGNQLAVYHIVYDKNGNIIHGPERKPESNDPTQELPDQNYFPNIYPPPGFG